VTHGDCVDGAVASLPSTASCFFTRHAETSLVNVGDFPTDQPIFLFFGAETFGFTDEIVADYQNEAWGMEVAFPIHQPSVVRCFNVATSASMALWHVYSQLATRCTLQQSSDGTQGTL
jgi:tRNA(Leu) C34 or U34 (ribose-2'-O)-methylase TrmL